MRFFNPTKVIGVAVLLTLRNMTKIHQTMIIVSAVLLTLQTPTQLYQTNLKEPPLKAKLHPHSEVNSCLRKRKPGRRFSEGF
jgi:hypothetical protein